MNDKVENNKNNDNNNNFVPNTKRMILVDEKEPDGELPPPFLPRHFEVKEDNDMRDFYDIKKEIGRGRFGTVYLVEDKITRQKFAAKFVNTKRNQDRANVEREVQIMKTLNSERPHPRLIQLYDAYDMEKEMCLVLEIVDGGELFERVTNDDFVLTERACTVFVRQICEGVEFIHSKNILHLDMKPENILCLSREGNRVKICDFGLARRYDPRKKLQVLFGTPEFVAPEVVNFEPIGFGTDMWSVGVICYVLLSGLSPFMGHNYVETMTNVTHNKYDFEDEAFDSVSDEAKDFIQSLLVLDKSLRPTPAQCLRSDWLRTPPPLCFHPLQRRFPSSASASEDDTTDEDDTEEEEEEKVVMKVEEKIQKDEEDAEKYSVRRRRRKEDEEGARRTKEEEERRKEMDVKRLNLERQIEEKKKMIAEEEEKCRRLREEEEEEMRKKKEEEEELRRKEEVKRREEARQKEERKREEEEARRKKEGEEARRKKVEEEVRRKKEEEEARRKKVEEEVRRKKEEEKARRKREEEQIKRRSEKRRREEEEERRTTEKNLRKEDGEKKMKEGEEKRRREAEEKRRKEVEEKKRKEAEKRKREEKEKREAVERRKLEEKEKRKEVEELRRKEVEEKRQEVEELRRKEVEELRRKEVEEKRQEVEDKKRKDEEDKEKEAVGKREEVKERRRRGSARSEQETEGEEVKEVRRRGSARSEQERELERSKAQLREFVARWNAHPNSPYAVAAAGDALRGLGAVKFTSGASLTSMAALPPNDLNLDDLDDEEEAEAADNDEEFIHYTISAPLQGPAAPLQATRSLDNMLQDTPAGRKGSGKGSRKGRGRSGSRGEKRRSSRSSSSRVLEQSEEAETIIQQILNVDHRSAYEEYQRMVTPSEGGGHLRWPEMVALQQQEGGAKRRSRNASPSWQPRRQPSRDVPHDRPPSRESDRSPVPTHRRPSRDVPLNLTQMERLANVAGGGAAPQAWPDLIVAPQGETDEEVRQYSLDVPVASLLKSPSGTLRSVPGLKVSPEPGSTDNPTSTPANTHKGAPSLTPPPSPPSEACTKPALSAPPSPIPTHKGALTPTPSSSNDNKTALTPPPSSSNHNKTALTPPPSPTLSKKGRGSTGPEDSPGRLVAWILDIGSKTPPRKESSDSLQDRVNHWEARDASPRPSPSARLSPSPRPTPSSSPSRRPTTPEERSGDTAAPQRCSQPPFNVLTSANPSTEKVIQTPWGALKRSPSRTSLSKSPSREREASPTDNGKAATLLRDAPEADPRSTQESQPARPQGGMVAWAAGGKSHTLPRSAKLLRQKSMITVPDKGDAAPLQADGSLKRKSKFPPSLNKRPLMPMLFSAQDRISMFEKQQPATRGLPRPLTRTRSSVTLSSSAPTHPSLGDRSQVGFMRTRLLGKAGCGAGPALPEEPTSPDPCRPWGPDAA